MFVVGMNVWITENQIFLGDDSLKFCHKGFGMGTKNEALWLANDL